MTTALPSSGAPHGPGAPGMTSAAPRMTPGALRMTPGRRVALAIGVPLALGLIGLTGLSFAGNIGGGSFPVSYDSLPVQHGQLALSVGSGDITLRQGQGGAARLAGTVNYTLLRPDIRESTSGTSTTIAFNCRLSIGNCGLTATLVVPPRTAVTLSSGGGNLDVGGVTSDVNLSSSGGNVTVSGVGGSAEVSTGGGNLDASGLAGILRFSTSGGNVNGNALAAPSVQADSGGGNVTLVFTRAPANLDITSSGGNINILLPHDSAGYDIIKSTTSGGSYSAAVPLSSSRAHTISVDSGGGNVSIAEAS